MFALNLETLILIAGALIGITFGLIGGVSKEARIKYVAISVFGSVLVAFIGISFYAYGYSLEFMLGFLISACLGFLVTFMLGLEYRKRRDKLWIKFMPSIYGPSRWEVQQIQSNMPKIDAELILQGNRFFGYKIKISIKMKNISGVTLNDLFSALKISDLNLKKKEKEVLRDLPNLVQNEEREFHLSKRIGWSTKYAVDLRISRNRVLLAEFHWTF
jgi:hypothetical protein